MFGSAFHAQVRFPIESQGRLASIREEDGCSQSPHFGQFSPLGLWRSRAGHSHLWPQSHSKPRQPRRTSEAEPAIEPTGPVCPFLCVMGDGVRFWVRYGPAAHRARSAINLASDASADDRQVFVRASCSQTYLVARASPSAMSWAPPIIVELRFTARDRSMCASVTCAGVFMVWLKAPDRRR